MKDHSMEFEGHVIAVNFAFKYVDYDLLCAFDDPRNHNFPCDERLHTNIEWVYKWKLNKWGVKGWSRKQRREGIVREEGIEIFGKSGSLFCAINVALKLGFKEIHVWGADMELKDGFCHFYDTERPNHKQRTHYINSFERHKKTKELFMSQLLPDEQIIWH